MYTCRTFCASLYHKYSTIKIMHTTRIYSNKLNTSRQNYVCYLGGVRRLLGGGGLGTRPDRRRLRSQKDQKARSIRSAYIQTYIQINYSNLIQHKHWKRKYKDICAAIVICNKGRCMYGLTIETAAAVLAIDVYTHIYIVDKIIIYKK